MNTDNKTDIDMVSSCANCGKGEEESDKLKNCTACMMVKYCSRECQIAHRPQHKKECRKRAAELHDEKLFKQPPPKEDCPICFMTTPLLESGWRYMTCCGKVICSGCCHAPIYDNQGNEVDNQKCPFCRTPGPKSDEEIDKRTIKRVVMNDPIAIHDLGCNYRDGTYGYPQDHTKALELYHRAAELGNALAHTCIGYSYNDGLGVEVDMEKANYFYELAAMKGETSARYYLGNIEARAGNIERALKHHMIAIKSGEVDSLNEIKQEYSNGQATKGDYTKALQSYQEYLIEIKSIQRDKAAEFDKERYRYY